MSLKIGYIELVNDKKDTGIILSANDLIVSEIISSPGPHDYSSTQNHNFRIYVKPYIGLTHSNFFMYSFNSLNEAIEARNNVLKQLGWLDTKITKVKNT